MRALILLFLTCVSVVAYAQDSTAIKLQQYKDLYEKGLITEQEYSQLKSKELDLSKPVPVKDSVDLKKLKRTYKTQLVTGSLEVAGGASLIGTGFIFKNKPRYKTSYIGINQVPYQEQIGYHTTQAAISFICGAVFTGIGLYSIIKGAKNRQKYFNLSPSGVSITF